MITIEHNEFGRRIGNATIYHIGDCYEIFRRTLEQTTPDQGYYSWSDRDIDKFKVIYPSYGYDVEANYQEHTRTLFLSLPRKSNLKAKASPLTALAGAFEDQPEEDEAYVLHAAPSLIREASEKIRQALGRTERVEGVDLSGLRLRYCNRLLKKHKEVQEDLILRLELESLEAEQERLEKLISDLVALYRSEISKRQRAMAAAK